MNQENALPTSTEQKLLQDIDVHLVYDLEGATDLLLQVEVPDFADQRIEDEKIVISETEHLYRVSAEDGIGMRLWIRADGRFTYDYSVRVHVDRPSLDLSMLDAVAPHLLPGDTVRYLMPSRYCPAELFQSFVGAEFGHLSGGARVVAMRDWVRSAFSYVPGSSNALTTALDSFMQRQGVCRDYAHVLIALVRASAIPARFVSAYAPGVDPQDFHAVVEVFLDGTWHLVDATGMAPADTIARVGVGLDAAEVSFLTSYGRIRMVEQSVASVVVS
ncbi:transglutaminase-like domain-containing protein [Palleronia aestuarii]|nr:transglutaminase family protein [Palleronia aestuarii]